MVSRVWLFTGTQDTVVYPGKQSFPQPAYSFHNHFLGVVEVSRRYYKHYVPSDENFLVGNIAAEHAWITDSYGNACSNLGSPYINNCNFDAAESLLDHLYNSTALEPKGNFNPNNVRKSLPESGADHRNSSKHLTKSITWEELRHPRSVWEILGTFTYLRPVSQEQV